MCAQLHCASQFSLAKLAALLMPAPQSLKPLWCTNVLPAYETGSVHKPVQGNLVAEQRLDSSFQNKLPVASIDALLNCHSLVRDTTLLWVSYKAPS